MGDSRWTHCELESKELLSVCLKKIKGTTLFGAPTLGLRNTEWISAMLFEVISDVPECVSQSSRVHPLPHENGTR